MSFRIVIVTFLCGAGCESTARPTLCSLKAETHYPLNTQQDCSASPEVMAVVDLSISLSLQGLFYAGYIKDYEGAVEQLKKEGIPLVCIIEKPEPCCLGSYCAPPYKENIAARKAGCATGYFAWASKYWPPICTKEWPDEPHCGNNSSSIGWEERLRHEIFNLAVLRWVGVRDPSYRHKVYVEVEPKVQAAFSSVQDIMK